MSIYDELYAWSVEKIEDFWSLIWDEADIVLSHSYDTILKERIMPGAKWFDGAKLNFAENLLRHRNDRIAVISYRENADPVRMTFAQLHDAVARCADGLKSLGVREGDRVAAFIPNIPEAVIGMLATTSIGALWSSCSPDFGLQGVIDRFGQIQPTVLLCANGYLYNGTHFDCTKKIRDIAHRLPQLKKIILINNTGEPSSPDLDSWIWWHDLLNNSASKIDFNQLPFDHPVYIMYSSGTTGAPKCIVHGAGGTLLQHWKEHVLHTDLKPGDVLSYFTTTGWMMWNWLVSGLQVGATIFLYDGSPGYPNLNVLWDAIDNEHIDAFGTSPKYLSSCQHVGLIPRNTHRLTSLRTIMSTGAPLSAENFNWVYQAVKSDVQLASISGGTDIISCFMLGNPLLPVYSEEIQSRGLGMKVETYNDAGKPVTNEVGELVCTAPFVSMPVSFWNDPDGAKYKDAYFDHFPGVWRHGDFIKITPHGGVIVYGRSDATLNPGGVRIGTAEIYNPLEQIEEITDAIVIGQRWKDDVRVVLFVVLQDGLSLNTELTEKIKRTIRDRATPRHVPKAILQVDAVPYTLNGKKVELAVSNMVAGKPVKNRDALLNPESLDQYAQFDELKR